MQPEPVAPPTVIVQRRRRRSQRLGGPGAPSVWVCLPSLVVCGARLDRQSDGAAAAAAVQKRRIERWLGSRTDRTARGRPADRRARCLEDVSAHSHRSSSATNRQVASVLHPVGNATILAVWLSGQDVGFWLADFPLSAPG